MQVYLDNSSTTKCSPAAQALMAQALCEGYGNPSSLHQKGVEGESYIKEARARICKTLKAKDTEIIFT